MTFHFVVAGERTVGLQNEGATSSDGRSHLMRNEVDPTRSEQWCEASWCNVRYEGRHRLRTGS
jgi:hypothetical protein